MHIRDLKWFEKAVQMRSLHSAAVALGVTQPALTKAVRRLETELGVYLLNRTPRGVIPTDMGNALLKRIGLLGEWELDTRALMSDMKAGETGELRIGVVPALLDSVLIPVFASALNADIRIRFHTSVQLSDVLLQQLNNGSLDLVVAALPSAQDYLHLGRQLLGKQFSHVVARKGHPLSRRHYTVAELAQYPWVLPPANISLRTWIDQLMAKAGVQIDHASVYTDATPAMFGPLLRQTNALTVMTADSMLTANGNGLVALDKPAPTWTLELGLFWRRNAYFSQRMETVRAQIAQAFLHRPGAH